MSLMQLNKNFERLPKTFSDNLEGKWVAVLDGEVISSDESFARLFATIKEKGADKKVLFHKVPKKEIIIV